MGFHTIRDGEMVAVWALDGTCTFIRGPKRIFTFRKRVEKLPLYSANQTSYLVVKFKDGHIDNVPGPTNLFYNPLLHSEISVRNSVSLTSHEVLVIYR